MLKEKLYKRDIPRFNYEVFIVEVGKNCFYRNDASLVPEIQRWFCWVAWSILNDFSLPRFGEHLFYAMFLKQIGFRPTRTDFFKKIEADERNVIAEAVEAAIEKYAKK